MRSIKSSCDVIHDASNLLDIRPACVVELSVARIPRTKDQAAHGTWPRKHSVHGPLRKSAEPAYWPRRAPALGQRCTRAGERSAATPKLRMTRKTAQLAETYVTLILKCPNTHERAQLRLGSRYASSHPGDTGLGEAHTHTLTARNRNQTIKCRTKIKQSNTTCNTTIPYHPEKESEQSKNR